MYGIVIKRIVLVGGLFSAVLCLIWNVYCEREFLYSCFVSLCVMFIVSSILNIGLQGIAGVLIKFLKEQQNELGFGDEDSQVGLDKTERK